MEDFAKWVQTYQAIIAVVLGVSGWIANHYFTLRAQEKNFVKQLFNTARLDITLSLRAYQNYLEALIDFYMLIWEMHEYNKPDLNKLANNKIITERYNLKCFLIIDEYNTLIPDLDIALDVLIDKHCRIITDIELLKELLKDPKIINENYPGDDDKIKFLIQCQEGKIPLINIQLALITDLIRFLQIKCFAEITGNAIRKKEDVEKTYRPKFIIENGKLIYSKGNDIMVKD